MASNLERLQQAGSIPEGAKLSDSEKQVIDGLSDDEVQTLINIRQKLDQQVAKDGTTAIASGSVETSSNIVI